MSHDISMMKITLAHESWHKYDENKQQMEHPCFYTWESQVVIMMETHLIAYFNHINACWPGSGVRQIWLSRKLLRNAETKKWSSVTPVNKGLIIRLYLYWKHCRLETSLLFGNTHILETYTETSLIGVARKVYVNGLKCTIILRNVIYDHSTESIRSAIVYDT